MAVKNNTRGMNNPALLEAFNARTGSDYKSIDDVVRDLYATKAVSAIAESIGLSRQSIYAIIHKLNLPLKGHIKASYLDDSFRAI